MTDDVLFRLCIDCRHHTTTDYCRLTAIIDRVDGHEVYQTCASQRSDGVAPDERGRCGPEGQHFEPRELSR